MIQYSSLSYSTLYTEAPFAGAAGLSSAAPKAPGGPAAKAVASRMSVMIIYIYIYIYIPLSLCIYIEREMCTNMEAVAKKAGVAKPKEKPKLCNTMLYYTMLYYAMLCYTILHYTTLHYTILYYTILYYTILYYSKPKEKPRVSLGKAGASVVGLGMDYGSL